MYLNFNSYTIDFEKALINSTKKIFEGKRQIGCYYHYCRNIREKAIDIGLFKNLKDDERTNFLNEFYKLPFKFYKNIKILDEIKLKYIKPSYFLLLIRANKPGYLTPLLSSLYNMTIN